jgi:hypothetical protein
VSVEDIDQKKAPAQAMASNAITGRGSVVLAIVGLAMGWFHMYYA